MPKACKEAKEWIAAHREEAAHLPDKVIAARFNITKRTIYSYRLEFGIHRIFKKTQKHKEKQMPEANDERKSDEAREFMLTHLVTPSKREEYLLTDAEIAKRFNLHQSTINGIRRALGIKSAFERRSKAPTSIQKIKIGGEEREYHGLDATPCSHLIGLKRSPGARGIPTLCVCALAEGSCEINRSRCNTTCPNFESTAATMRSR